MSAISDKPVILLAPPVVSSPTSSSAYYSKVRVEITAGDDFETKKFELYFSPFEPQKLVIDRDDGKYWQELPPGPCALQLVAIPLNGENSPWVYVSPFYVLTPPVSKSNQKT